MSADPDREGLDETDRYYLEGGGYSYSDEAVDRWLAKHFSAHLALPRSGRVLDLCCGDGVWSFGLLRLDPTLEIHALDISAGAIASARARAADQGIPAERFVTHDAERPLPYEDGSFELVFARGVFLFNQHDLLRPEAVALLARWHTSLSAGGVFFSSYGSRLDLMGTYSAPEDTRLPLNRRPRLTGPVDFAGGKFHHSMASLTEAFRRAPGVRIVKYVYELGRHTVVSRRGDDPASR